MYRNYSHYECLCVADLSLKRRIDSDVIDRCIFEI